MKHPIYLLFFIFVMRTVLCNKREKRQDSTASERGNNLGLVLGQAIGGTVNNLLGGLLGGGGTNQNNGCNVNNGGCEQGCTEVQSRVHCYCHSGFVLNRDQRTCSQASSVSCSENNGGCEQDCITKGNGDITCKCGKGFVLADDNKTCYDIDECSRGQKCRPESTCVNTVGGYICSLDGITTCREKNGGCDHSCRETNRGIICRCNKGFQLHKNGKSCFRPNAKPEPVDPCQNNNGGCEQICLNDGDSVRCECRDGFAISNGRCVEPRVEAKPTPLVTSPQQKGCGINMKKTLFRRIVGGKPADPKDWPWMAAILRQSGSQFCGGVLITDRHVLTAAHCVVQFTKNEIKVRLGEYNFDTPDENNPTDFGVEEIKSHENYDSATQENDIAIIKIDRPSSFSDFIWPACLPPPDNNFEGFLGFVTGWGTIYFGGPVSERLLEVVLPIWNQSECRAVYPENKVSENMMCAGLKEGGKDSCQGDSGGPFLIQIQPNPRWYVAGIVSWGIECASANRPGVYTRVNKYLDWIKANALF